jgi:hypothetical protein
VFPGRSDNQFVFLATCGHVGHGQNPRQMVYECVNCRYRRVHVNSYLDRDCVDPRPGRCPVIDPARSPDIRRHFLGFQLSTPVSSYSADKRLCAYQGHVNVVPKALFLRFRAELHAIVSRIVRKQCNFAMAFMKSVHEDTGLAVIGADGVTVYLVGGARGHKHHQSRGYQPSLNAQHVG